MTPKYQQRCIVTGGAGFIGSHITERLLAANHAVTVIDNCSTGRVENIAHLQNDENLTFFNTDIRDRAAITSYFAGVDWVFHLAALGDIVPSINMPDAYFSSNVDGTYNVLEASRNAGARRLIYAASSSSYGIPDIYPTPETAEMRPQYPYALTKWLAEELVMHWGLVYGLPVVALRLFNTYGPRSRTSGAYGAVFGVFLAQLIAEEPFTVVGDGTQTRDFTFVTDVAKAFISAADSEVTNICMNVGSGGTYSINRLVELLDNPAGVVHIPKRPGEPDCTFADVSQIKEKLNWSPTVPFEDGVQVMLDNIDYWREAPVWNAKSIADATREWFKYLDKHDEASS
ncbi:MAG: NAD-dependent dehydratase [Magnetovibrio sp.]|nr:NAD-dependent dehydratase [Magnetovibrio sp.]